MWLWNNKLHLRILNNFYRNCNKKKLVVKSPDSRNHHHYPKNVIFLNPFSALATILRIILFSTNSLEK
jgi:hypothetical protein